MADLYSVISGIQPDQQDILEAELLAKQILEANFPDLDLREGTGVRDLVLRPSAFLLALCKKGYDTYFAQNTLSGITDTTPNEVLDGLMGNLFLTRKTGTYAVINARLYFARAKNISLTQDTSFSTDGAILFYPLSNAAYASTAMQYDSYQNEWYIDLDLKAANTGVSYNISEGSLLYFSNFDPYFLHAEINYLRNSSTDAETNTQFVSRATTAISTRNLINTPSIISNLGANFNTIPNILPIGSGDPEMYRDQVKVKLDPLPAVQVSSISESLNVVTVVLVNHGFVTGQNIIVSGAVPNGYNGTYNITVVNSSTFVYIDVPSLAVATTLPSVQSVETDLYIHQAGTVDIYCDSSLLVTANQYTLDSTGSTNIIGPIIEVSRSSVSGGSSPDTLPLAPIVPYTSEDVIDPTKFYSTISGLTTGNVVAISGLLQSIAIASISCLAGNSYVTVHSPGHPISSSGSLITISGVTPTDYNGDYVGFRIDADNFSYQVPTRISLSGSGGTMITKNRGLLLNQYPTGAVFGTVTVSSTYFNVVMPNLWSGVAVTGVAVITNEPPFILSYPGYTTRSDATFLVDSTSPQQQNQISMPGNPLGIGRYVQISGSSNALNNQIWKVTSIVNANTVNISAPIYNGYAAGIGPITVKFVNPVLDLGFSSDQILTVNYGVAYAGQTVSLQTISFSNIENVQAYLENSNNRVLCGDIMARGFDIYLLDISLTVYNSAAPTTGAAQILINSYLKSLAPGAVFVVSDLVSVLNAGGISNLRIPASITATFYQRDMFDFDPFQIVDVFDPANSTAVYVLNSIVTSSMAV